MRFGWSGADCHDFGTQERRRICAHHRRSVEEYRQIFAHHRHGGQGTAGSALTPVAVWKSTAESALTTAAAA